MADLLREKKKCFDFFFSFQNSFIEMQVSYGTVYLITVYNPVWGIFTNVRKHLHNFRTFLPPHKETLYPLAVLLHSLHPSTLP